MTNKEIKIQVKNVYGIEKFYPKCEQSQLFADIAGTVTLMPQVLQKIEKLGFLINVSQPMKGWK